MSTEQTAPAEGLTREIVEAWKLMFSAETASLVPAIVKAAQEKVAICDMALRSLAPQASPEGNKPCCTQWDTCKQPCTPRGSHKATKRVEGFVAKAAACLPAEHAKALLDEFWRQMDGQGASAQIPESASLRGESKQSRLSESEAHPTPPQGSGETKVLFAVSMEELKYLPRLDECISLDNGGNPNLTYARVFELARTLECETIRYHEMAVEKELQYAEASGRAIKAEAALTTASAQSAAGAEAVCGVCLGAGVPVSGHPCICNGIGTQDAEVAGLREALQSLGRIQILPDGNQIIVGSARPAPPAVPEGMVMVPSEPTENMVKRFMSVYCGGSFALAYRAMLSAAPRAKEGA